MKKLPLLALFLLICLHPNIAQQKIGIDDCFSYFRFYPQSAPAIRFAPDGKTYFGESAAGLALMDIETGKEQSVIMDQVTLGKMGKWDDYQYNNAFTIFLFRTDSKPVYRHSTKATYWVYVLDSKRMQRMTDRDDVQFAALSPDGKKVAYVLDNNLFYFDIASGKSTAISTDGLENQVINGLPDWLYEEEFSPVDGNGMVATVWSPDSRQVAWIRFDESQVPYYTMTEYNSEAYPAFQSFKYPKVGEPNALVSVHLFDTEAQRRVGRVMNLEAEDYVPRLHFTPDNRLVVHRLNRAQDTLELLIAMPERPITDEDGAEDWLPCRLLLRETDPAYVDIHDNLIFLQDGRRYIWTSEKEGFNRAYIHYLDRAAAVLPEPLTPNDCDLTALYGIDEKNGKIYYQTATPTPMDRQIWEGNLTGETPRLLTSNSGTHNGGFSPNFQYWLHTWSDANNPTIAQLERSNGDTVRTMLNNKRVAMRRNEYGFVQKTFWHFDLPDGTSLNGWMLRPDSLEPGKKYPVLFDIYGGPGSQTVLNEYEGYLDPWRQMLVQKGIIVVSVDNRGTGSRGRDFKKITQLQLGKLETEDQIAAAKYLGTLPYVDPARIGIWGWSFGGYLSSSCILKGSDVFEMAMAVAPVTNWKWYDSAYTERYMRTLRDNGNGYEENSPINFTGQLKGPLLICHGIADDNVHWQQTTEMVNALIASNKLFELGYYPNRNHGIYGDNATRHLFSKLTEFVLKTL
ncbi:MAG: DPP IV N-terminal domain-containing protein [Lewinellaceae bacterium]|nr:DPP IV N-terminal domain-containing protein [Lewinellaceae bacterium]